MSKFKTIAWLIFITVVALRLWVAFSSPYFDYDSYFSIRQVDSIVSTGLPAYNDALSYGGGFFIFPPLFHYVIAFFSLIAPLGIIGKIIPNVLYALLIPLSYYISREITGDRKMSLVAPAIVAFIPVFWSNVFTLDPLSMAIPALFCAFYFLIKRHDKRDDIYFLALAIFTSFVHPIAIIIIPVLWLYILFIKIEKIKEKVPLTEFAIFLTFFVLLVEFLFYKNAILVNGPGIIWQNIPASIFQNYFANIGVLDAIINIGVLSLIFGLYEIYVFSFERKERASSLFISLVIVLGIFLWLKLIPFRIGMIIMGTGISIVSIFAIKSFVQYFEKIKFKNFRIVTVSVIIIFLITALIPAFYYLRASRDSVPDRNEINAMLWLRENSSEGSTIAGDVNDGFMISAVAGRKNVIDGNFLMKEDIDERFQDISTIYQTKYETNALGLLNKYNAKYIFFGKNVMRSFNASMLNFEDKNCFDTLFDTGGVKIYKTWCDLE